MSSESLLPLAGGLGLLGLAVFAFRKAMQKRSTPPSATNNWQRAEAGAANGLLRNDTLTTTKVGLGSGENI